MKRYKYDGITQSYRPIETFATIKALVKIAWLVLVHVAAMDDVASSDPLTHKEEQYK